MSLIMLLTEGTSRITSRWSQSSLKHMFRSKFKLKGLKISNVILFIQAKSAVVSGRIRRGLSMWSWSWVWSCKAHRQ